MYQIGEWIFYGNIGACQVMDISTKTIPGVANDHLYYTLQPLNDSCSISAPADSGRVFMRPLISKEEAEILISEIPTITAQAYYSAAVRQLTEHYEAELNTHDCYALVRLTMSIYAKKEEVCSRKKKLGAVDEKFMKRAEDLLFGELAVALGVEKNQVAAYIAAEVAKREKIIGT